MGIKFLVKFKFGGSMKNHPNVNAAYSGIVTLGSTDTYSARNVTNNERIPFILLAGLDRSEGWRSGSLRG